jgi:hypothetical protein
VQFVHASHAVTLPLNHLLYDELVALEQAIALACPPYSMSRRAVAVPNPFPTALRWFWEVFGANALTQQYVAPDDKSAQIHCIETLSEWAHFDAQYEPLAERAQILYAPIAWDEDEMVLCEKTFLHTDHNPTLVRVRAPSDSAEAPEFEVLHDRALAFMTRGVLKGLWGELVRVLLMKRPPVEIEVPFPNVCPHVGKAMVGGTAIWIVERDVRESKGFAMYFAPRDTENVESWLTTHGLSDDLLV